MRKQKQHFHIGSCKGLQTSQRIFKDGEYSLTVRGRKVLIYCYNMTSVNPQEFITLSGMLAPFFSTPSLPLCFYYFTYIYKQN